MLMIRGKILIIVLIVITFLNIVFLFVNRQNIKNEKSIDSSKYVLNTNKNKISEVKLPVQDKYCIDFNATATEKDKIAQSVSMMQLISNPKEYHCKKIKIIGYVILQYEEYVVYFHYDDYKYFISKNALALDFRESQNLTIKNLGEISNKYVLIEGNFDAYQGSNDFSGSVNNITRFEIWPNRFELRKSVKKNYSR